MVGLPPCHPVLNKHTYYTVLLTVESAVCDSKGEVKLLQYVDDLLIAGETEKETWRTTIELLNFLRKKRVEVLKI